MVVRGRAQNVEFYAVVASHVSTRVGSLFLPAFFYRKTFQKKEEEKMHEEGNWSVCCRNLWSDRSCRTLEENVELSAAQPTILTSRVSLEWLCWTLKSIHNDSREDPYR